MDPDPRFHGRHSIRLKGYDSTQLGAYFVTVCTWGFRCIFGFVDEGEMQLYQVGQVVAAEWVRSAVIRKELQLDSWVVMPNRLYGMPRSLGSLLPRVMQAAF